MEHLLITRRSKVLKMLRQLVIVVTMCVASMPVGHAQTATYEAITVSTVAVGVASATYGNPATTGQRLRMCSVRVETAAIRFRLDGTNPTSSVGTPMSADDVLDITNTGVMADLKFIRSGGSDATVHVWCWQ